MAQAESPVLLEMGASCQMTRSRRHLTGWGLLAPGSSFAANHVGVAGERQLGLDHRGKADPVLTQGLPFRCCQLTDQETAASENIVW